MSTSTKQEEKSREFFGGSCDEQSICIYMFGKKHTQSTHEKLARMGCYECDASRRDNLFPCLVKRTPGVLHQKRKHQAVHTQEKPTNKKRKDTVVPFFTCNKKKSTLLQDKKVSAPCKGFKLTRTCDLRMSPCDT